ncbi:MAG: hypothetical protein J1E34_07820 [Oscillospiraceae bacterium]|nr:hypothetical protein [Oscillospiraceae bacterium]
MKKFTFAILLSVLILPFFSGFVSAENISDEFEEIYSGVFSSIDGETRSLLESAGVSEADFSSLLNLSPNGLYGVIKELFGKTAGEKASLFGMCLVLIILIRLFSSFMSSSHLKEAAENIGSVFLVFSLIVSSSAIADSCVSALMLTKNFMLTLIPVLGAILAFSGNELSALSVNTSVFAFAEGISVLFSDIIVPLTVVGAALGAAAAISPVSGIEKFSALVNRLITAVMGFVSGIFAAVLSIRGVIAGAQDTMTLRGLRFMINGSVPVVGSAIGDALGSLSAGLGLIKNSAAILGVLAVAFINLPSLCSLIIWKLMMYLLSLAAEMFEIKKISGFISVFTSIFNVIIAVMLFNAFLFIISLAIIITVKTGG